MGKCYLFITVTASCSGSGGHRSLPCISPCTKHGQAPFSALTAFKSCTSAEVILPSVLPLLCSTGKVFPMPAPPPFTGKAAFHGPPALQDAGAQPRLSQRAGGRRRLGKGPLIPSSSPPHPLLVPSHPRGAAGASRAFLGSAFRPGPPARTTRGCTWNSSAAGSASASVAEGPDRQ